MVDKSLVKKRKAFTLVEIMIVSMCLAIIIYPIFMLLRSGQDSSLKGMMRIETTMKARVALQRVYADLKMACKPISAKGEEYSFTDILKKDGGFPNITYTFDTFPIHKKYSEIFRNVNVQDFDNDGINYRLLSTVSYKVEEGNNPNLPFKKLIRRETFDNKTTEQIITDKLNYFEIKEIDLAIGDKHRYYYLITLQLIEVLHDKDIKDKKSDEKLRENQKDVILADFYDLVYPEYFNALWNNQKENGNWHTRLINSASASQILTD